MIYTLENDQISVKVKQLGAELCSYFDKENSREIIWNANAKFWGRHAPILFPIIGKVENNTYTINKKPYNLTQHGFARDQDYKIISQTNSTLILGLESTKETLENYPFEFKLQVEISIHQKEVKVLYRVINPSNSSIYFCIGAHPAFNVPFDNTSTFTDYELTLEKEENSDRLLLTPEGFRTGTNLVNWLQGSTIKLTEELFTDDALIFDDLKSRFLTINSVKSNQSVKVSWNNYPHMGIWKQLNNAPFICVEPWNGMADQVGLGNDFKEKKGIINLTAKATFECSYSIENIIS
ncbi:MAG: galactose mutarotase-like enzyme [Flavobacteriales bacterium]|jgi:galactose mutarotase-like enzyme|tara:strand:+ start:504 stop:1385 length:882 start_codon:yes stop_codon:yes gene_type:complete